MYNILLDALRYYALLLHSIRDILLVTQFLIVSNYVLATYNRKTKAKPLWLYLFAAIVAICGTRLFDMLHIVEYALCNYVSQTICYYQMYLLLKHTGRIFGVDITKFINKKNNGND